jgi:hypothetical protein
VKSGRHASTTLVASQTKAAKGEELLVHQFFALTIFAFRYGKVGEKEHAPHQTARNHIDRLWMRMFVALSSTMVCAQTKPQGVTNGQDVTKCCREVHTSAFL